MKLIIADDHPVSRLGLIRILADLKQVRIVSVAGDTDELLSAAVRHAPDLILTDLCMPSRTHVAGIEMLKSLSVAVPASRVLVLTAVTHRPVLRRVMESGRISLVMKASGPGEIVRAVEAARLKVTYMCPLAIELTGRN